jgi:hypothetical protein
MTNDAYQFDGPDGLVTIEADEILSELEREATEDEQSEPVKPVKKPRSKKS